MPAAMPDRVSRLRPGDGAAPPAPAATRRLRPFELGLAALLVAAIAPYFVGLNDSSIWDANEAFYVETPREMMERGDYISPTFNYEPRLNKPVLVYWVVAGFYHLFGVSPGVQRIPIALGAVAMIATAFLLAWAWAPAACRVRRDAADGPDPAPLPLRPVEAGLWAALGLAINPRLLMFARRIIIDIYISMFLALTLLFFALSERFPERRRLFLILMYAAAGLGALTKGPIALVLPALVFAAYLAIHGELSRIRSMMLPAGAAVVAAILAPWYAALYVREGWGPIWTFVLGENVARYTDGVGVNSDRGPLFYLPVLLSDSLPWSLFLPAAAAIWWRARRGTPGEPGTRHLTLLWLWTIVIVLFFTASAAKQDLYIFPVVPAVGALAGIAIMVGLRRLDGWTRWTPVAIGLFAAVAGAGLLYLFGSAGSIYALEGARLMGTMAMAGGLLAAGLAAARRSRTALLALAVTFVGLHVIFVAQALPGFERYKPAPGFARTLEPRLQPPDRLVTFDEALPSLVYYLRRHIDPYFDEQEFLAAFQAGGTVYGILSTENYRRLAGRLGVPTCEIERRPTFDVKLRNIVAQQPLPELVLITNRCGPEAD
jgi:4-amino-4-deoxy-L-arabinose transferase-like glycosyltransferase